MEDPSSPTTSTENSAEGFTQTLSAQRSRVEEFLSAQRDRLDRAQAELAQHAQRIAEELERNRGETAQTREGLEQRVKPLTVAD